MRVSVCVYVRACVSDRVGAFVCVCERACVCASVCACVLARACVSLYDNAIDFRIN